jgi:N-acetylglucosaminyldiphosphoundecaprenol N-acetyl-beta-D-mannosaminyltransferase
MKKISVLRSLISVGTYQEFIHTIFSLVNDKVSSYVCFANVHMVMEGYNDNAFQKIINNASVVAPDGKPISLFITYFQKHKQERVCGMDLLPDLLREAELRNKSVYFLGGTQKLLNTLVLKTAKEFPALKISGTYSPPFRNLSEEENLITNQQIKTVAPDLVFVSLGCPKQEKWMAENRDTLGTCLLGVGQAFNVYAGVEKRLPVWMRNLSLEWVYRFYLEPKRLWKRYVFTNSHFLLLTVRHILTRVATTLQAPFGKTKNQENVLRESQE